MTDYCGGFFDDDYDDFEDMEDEFGDNNLFDDYDDIEEEIEEESKSEEDIGDLGPDELAIALAFGESIKDDNGKYDMDENTDKENMREALKYSKYSNKTNLRPFERYVKDICDGKRPLFGK